MSEFDDIFQGLDHENAKQVLANTHAAMVGRATSGTLPKRDEVAKLAEIYADLQRSLVKIVDKTS